jgi:ribosomal protein S14
MSKFVRTNCDICGEFGRVLRIPLLSTSLGSRKFLDLCIHCVRQAAVHFLGGRP